jgi:hypothetical protein
VHVDFPDTVRVGSDLYFVVYIYIGASYSTKET